MGFPPGMLLGGGCARLRIELASTRARLMGAALSKARGTLPRVKSKTPRTLVVR